MKYLKSLLALTLLLSAASHAEDEGPSRNSISVHPFMSLIVLGGSLSWEHSFGEGYWTSEVPLHVGLQPGQALNLGAGLGVRRYLDAGAHGWYASPQLSLIDFNQYGPKAYSPGQRNLWLLGTVRAGYKKELGRLALDGAVGGGYLKDFHTRKDQDLFDIVQPTWTPVVHLSAGWTF